MSKLDLHIHSSYSDDGELSPGEIAARCMAQNMELIAITDHNSVCGVDEAVTAANGGLRVLSGVELDCVYGGKNFHLLGYCFDHSRKEFEEIERDILRQEREAAGKKIELFTKATSIPVNASEILEAARGGVVPGELIGAHLLARGDAARYELLRPYLPGGAKSDMPNIRFYWDFFSEGKPAYVPIRYLSLSDGVALLHSAGGVAVLAHPGQNFAGDDSLLQGILSEKIDGIEVFSTYHSPETAAHYLEIAEQNQLIVTCGSDFHGKHKPQIRLGGHGASWSDPRLAAGFSSWLSGRA